ncbi:MAG: glutamine synthetase family protein [Muribaculaceae bacterium]|nr:glutamine synthetase family protein [Muribaculaceae bacterium]
MNNPFSLHCNPVIRFLQKNPKDITLDDIIRYVGENGIKMINFMYPAGDGRLKTLNFVINDLSYLRTILTLGERVDGSSLFDFVNAGSSDLYVVPRYRTVFVDPISEIPTLTFLCSYFNKDGKPLEGAPERTLQRACELLTEDTGLALQAMGELEYYVISQDTGNFAATDQKGYHESAPFAKHNEFRTRCMMAIAATGAKIKYGHSEVGNFTLADKIYEQNEIEFLPVDACDAADQLMVAKWIIRNLAAKENLNVTFAPKITVGKAGSGLHIHMRLLDKNGKSVMLEDGKLSDTAKRAIGGLMLMAPALTAFGNRNPTSYFRLVPHQESPTNICWGDRNRSVLVRVPLGWTSDSDMCAVANPGSHTPDDMDASRKQTVEIRNADGSANIYQLLAGLAVAIRYGVMHPDIMETVERTYVDVNIHARENAEKLKALSSLPASCSESADCLERSREVFEQGDVFPAATIDSIITYLRSFDSKETQEALENTSLMLKMVQKYFHC